MPKAKQKELDERWQLYLIRRECVRRNPDYNTEYAKWQSDKRYEVDSVLVPFTDRWGLLSSELPPDPKNRPSLEKVKAEKKPIDVPLPHEYSFDPYCINAMDTLDQKHASADKDSPALDSILVLTYFHEGKTKESFRSVRNMRRPKEELMKSIERLVNWILEARAKAGLMQNHSRKKMRPEKYFDYLEVYDLRQAGKKFSEIAVIKWAGNRGDMEKKAKRHYEKGRRLVIKPPIL